MNRTPYLGLRLPEQTDPATEADINYNSQIIDANIGVLSQRLGTLSFWYGSQAQYDAIGEPDEHTVYIIVG